MPEPILSRAPGSAPGHVTDPASDRSPGWQQSLVDRVALEVAAVSWPEPEEIRARGRRRNRIRSVVGTVAVVVAVTVGSVGLVDRYGGQPQPTAALPSSPSASAAPSATASPDPALSAVDPALDPAAIPSSALLQPEDVGPGLVVDRVNVSADAVVDLIDPTVLLGCPGYGAYDRYTGLARMTRGHTVQHPPTVPGDPHSGQAVVHEKVFRLAPDAARRVFAEARAVPHLCARYVSSGVIEIDGRRLPVDAEHRWRILAEGFAGNESVLMEWETTIRRQDNAGVVDGPTARLLGVVRVGDLVAAVDRVDEAPDPERARALTLGAAVRLCDVANPPC